MYQLISLSKKKITSSSTSWDKQRHSKPPQIALEVFSLFHARKRRYHNGRMNSLHEILLQRYRLCPFLVLTSQVGNCKHSSNLQLQKCVKDPLGPINRSVIGLAFASGQNTHTDTDTDTQTHTLARIHVRAEPHQRKTSWIAARHCRLLKDLHDSTCSMSFNLLSLKQGLYQSCSWSVLHNIKLTNVLTV